MNIHEVAPREPKIGRNYSINPAVFTLFFDEQHFSQKPNLTDNERENIIGFSAGAFGQYKTGIPAVFFGEVKSKFTGEPPKDNRLGIMLYYEERMPYDLVRTDSSQIIIPRGTNVVTLVIPTIHFPHFRKITAQSH